MTRRNLVAKMNNNLTSSSKKEDGSMIFNLPLLFADGLPTSLDKIKLESLELFIPFMLKCSQKSESLKNTPPHWWDSKIPYKIPLIRPKRIHDWISSLKKLVSKCYASHGCQFILDFCKTLSTIPIESLNFVKNFDGTTSLYNIGNGKLLVSFRNENRTYDKKFDNSYKNLLPKPRLHEKKQILPDYDIYLCDNCDEEFFSLKDANNHEKRCYFQIDLTIEDEENTNEDPYLFKDQNSFLSYFNLKNNHDENINPSASIELESIYKICKKKQFGNIHFSKYSSIPFSSPLGISIQKRRHKDFYQTNMERIDRFCSTKVKNPKTDYSYPVSITFKKKSDLWTHMYKFKRKIGLQKGQPKTEGQKRTELLLKQFKEVRILLKRLTNEEILFHTKPKVKKQIGPTRSPIIIDLCSTDDELDNIKDNSSSTSKPNKTQNSKQNEYTFENKIQFIPDNYLFLDNTNYIKNELENSLNTNHLYQTLEQNLSKNDQQINKNIFSMNKKELQNKKWNSKDSSQDLLLGKTIYF